MAKALVLYHSGSGNTEQMAKAVAEGMKSGGLEVNLWNADKKRFDASTFGEYQCAAFGSPDYFSYVAGSLKTFMDDWYIAKGKGAKNMTGKPYGVFFSHGGGGRIKEAMEKLFSYIGKQVGASVACEGKPDDKILEACRKLGKDLAAAK